MGTPCITSTVNLSNLPTMAGSPSPTLEAVVVAVLLLPGQGTHSRKDYVQQQAALQRHSGSWSSQAQDFQGENPAMRQARRVLPGSPALTELTSPPCLEVLSPRGLGRG